MNTNIWDVSSIFAMPEGIASPAVVRPPVVLPSPEDRQLAIGAKSPSASLRKIYDVSVNESTVYLNGVRLIKFATAKEAIELEKSINKLKNIEGLKFFLKYQDCKVSVVALYEKSGKSIEESVFSQSFMSGKEFSLPKDAVALTSGLSIILPGSIDKSDLITSRNIHDVVSSRLNNPDLTDEMRALFAKYLTSSGEDHSAAAKEILKSIRTQNEDFLKSYTGKEDQEKSLKSTIAADYLAIILGLYGDKDSAKPGQDIFKRYLRNEDSELIAAYTKSGSERDAERILGRIKQFQIEWGSSVWGTPARAELYRAKAALIEQAEAIGISSEKIAEASDLQLNLFSDFPEEEAFLNHLQDVVNSPELSDDKANSDELITKYEKRVSEYYRLIFSGSATADKINNMGLLVYCYESLIHEIGANVEQSREIRKKALEQAVESGIQASSNIQIITAGGLPTDISDFLSSISHSEFGDYFNFIKKNAGLIIFTDSWYKSEQEKSMVGGDAGGCALGGKVIMINEKWNAIPKQTIESLVGGAWGDFFDERTPGLLYFKNDAQRLIESSSLPKDSKAKLVEMNNERVQNTGMALIHETRHTIWADRIGGFDKEYYRRQYSDEVMAFGTEYDAYHNLQQSGQLKKPSKIMADTFEMCKYIVLGAVGEGSDFGRNNVFNGSATTLDFQVYPLNTPMVKARNIADRLVAVTRLSSSPVAPSKALMESIKSCEGKLTYSDGVPRRSVLDAFMSFERAGVWQRFFIDSEADILKPVPDAEKMIKDSRVLNDDEKEFLITLVRSGNRINLTGCLNDIEMSSLVDAATGSKDESAVAAFCESAERLQQNIVWTIASLLSERGGIRMKSLPDEIRPLLHTCLAYINDSYVKQDYLDAVNAFKKDVRKALSGDVSVFHESDYVTAALTAVRYAPTGSNRVKLYDGSQKPVSEINSKTSAVIFPQSLKKIGTDDYARTVLSDGTRAYIKLSDIK